MENERAGRKFINVKKIASRLFDEFIITEDEKRKMEVLKPMEMKAVIFDFAFTPKWKVPLKKMKRIISNICDHEEPENSESACSAALQNPLIMGHIFGLLEFEDQKNFRVVCKNWNLGVESTIRKNAAITFGHLNDFTTLRPDDFMKTFCNSFESTTVVDFTSFRFLDSVDWRIEEFKDFFKQQKQIKDLQLHNVFIVNKEARLGRDFDISDWFTDLSLSELTVRCNGFFNKPPTTLAFSTDVLISLTHINLNSCNLKVGNKRPINPLSIELTDLKFWKNGRSLREYCVNDLIDFSKAKNITITCGDDEVADSDELSQTTPNLDLSKCLGLNAKQMSLYKIPVFNWNVCKVVVKTLKLGRIPFLVKTTMEIRELHFNGSSIDLFALPLTIEKIHFGWSLHYKTKIFSSQPVDLPNLKRLVVECDENFKDLQLFADCPNLLYAEIQSNSKETVEFNLRLVPDSVKQLSLKGIIAVYSIVRVDKLVLINYSLANAAKVMENVKTNVLVLQWERKYENNLSVLQFLQEFEDLTLYVGPFNWDDKINIFESSPFRAYVDQKAEYYVFRNNQRRGESIHSLYNIVKHLNEI